MTTGSMIDLPDLICPVLFQMISNNRGLLHLDLTNTRMGRCGWVCERAGKVWESVGGLRMYGGRLHRLTRSDRGALTQRCPLPLVQ